MNREGKFVKNTLILSLGTFLLKISSMQINRGLAANFGFQEKCPNRSFTENKSALSEKNVGSQQII